MSLPKPFFSYIFFSITQSLCTVDHDSSRTQLNWHIHPSLAKASDAVNSAGRKQFDLFTEKHGELRRPCIPKPRYLNRWLQFCSRGAAAAPCYIPRGRVTPGASHSATPHSLRSSCPAPSPRRPRLRAAPRSGQDRAIPAYAPASAAAAPSPPSPARPASPAAGAALPAWGPLAPNTARKPCGKEAPVPTRRAS